MLCLPDWWQDAEPDLYGDLDAFMADYEAGAMAVEYNRRVADNALEPARLSWLITASLGGSTTV